MVDYIQLTWKLVWMLRTYRTYNSTVGFSKYKFSLSLSLSLSLYIYIYIYEFMDWMVDYIQLTWMLRTYRTCNSIVRFSKYKLYLYIYMYVCMCKRWTCINSYSIDIIMFYVDLKLSINLRWYCK